MYIYIYYDDEMRIIRHRYKVIKLIVSARKINNNNNKTRHNTHKKTKKLTEQMT